MGSNAWHIVKYDTTCRLYSALYHNAAQQLKCGPREGLEPLRFTSFVKKLISDLCKNNARNFDRRILEMSLIRLDSLFHQALHLLTSIFWIYNNEKRFRKFSLCTPLVLNSISSSVANLWSVKSAPTWKCPQFSSRPNKILLLLIWFGQIFVIITTQNTKAFHSNKWAIGQR